MHKFLLTLALITLAFTPNANADEQFSTEACDFTVDLPGEFFRQTICKDSAGINCTEKARYTDITDESGVSADVLCVPMEEGFFQVYDKDVIGAFTARILQEYGIDPEKAEYNYEEDPKINLKNTTAFVDDTFGQTPTFMIVQFWVTPTSMLNTEIRVVGNNNTAAHETAAKIMRSIKLKETYKPASVAVDPFVP